MKKNSTYFFFHGLDPVAAFINSILLSAVNTYTAIMYDHYYCQNYEHWTQIIQLMLNRYLYTRK